MSQFSSSLFLIPSYSHHKPLSQPVYLKLYATDFKEGRDTFSIEDRFDNDIDYDNRTTRVTVWDVDETSFHTVVEGRTTDRDAIATGAAALRSYSAPDTGDGPDMNLWLQRASEYFLEAREEAEKILILFFANENHSSTGALLAQCNAVKQMGVKIIAVAIQMESVTTASDTELKNFAKQVASEPASENAFLLYSSGDSYYVNWFNHENEEYETYIKNYGFAAPNTIISQATGNNDIGQECSLTGFGHFSTFDGHNYEFNGYGDYWLTAPCTYADSTQALSIQAQVRMTACDETCAPDLTPSRESTTTISQGTRSGVSCARGYAFKYNGHTFEASWQASNGDLSIIIDGDLKCRNAFDSGVESNVVGNPSNVALSGSDLYWSVRQRFLGGYDVEFTIVKNSQLNVDVPQVQTNIFISFNLEGSADIQLRTDQGVVGKNNFVGLCGALDKCPVNDFTNSKDNVINPSDSMKSLYYNFAETWKVEPFNSLFLGSSADQSFNVDEWQPRIAALKSTSSPACDFLPSGSLLHKRCENDVSVSGSDTVSESHRIAYYRACETFCVTGRFSSALFTQVYRDGNEGMCDLICRNEQPVEQSYLHLNTEEGHFPSVDILGEDLPSALFLLNPSNIGGTYTFNRTVSRPDLCVEPDVNGTYTQNDEIVDTTVTINVACLDLPTVSIVPIGYASFGPWGFPDVQFRATVDGDLPEEPQVIVPSWSIVGFEPRDGEEGTLSDVASIRYSNAFVAQFQPNMAGVYNVSFVITDGCGVSRSYMTFEVLQKCCTPAAHIKPLATLIFDDGEYEAQQVILAGSSTSLSQVQDNGGNQCLDGNQYNNGQTSGDSSTGAPMSLGLTNRFYVSQYGYKPNQNATTATWELVNESGGIVQYHFNDTVSEEVTLVNTTATISSSELNEGDEDNRDADALPSYEGLAQTLKSVIQDSVNFRQVVNVTTVTYSETSTLSYVPAVVRMCDFGINYVAPNTSFAVQPEDSGETYNTDGSQCEGFYTLNSDLNVDGYGDYCVNTASTIVQVSCGHAPVLVLDCENESIYNHGSDTFDAVTINLSKSFSYKTATELRYKYVVASKPDGSSIDTDLGCPASPSDSCTFTPDAAGTYFIEVGVTDGCKKAEQTIQVHVGCGDAFTVNSVVDEIEYDADDTNPIVHAHSNTTEGPGDFTLSYNGTTLPTVSSVVAAVLEQVNGGFYSVDTATDGEEFPHITIFAGGEYTFTTHGDDGCQEDETTFSFDVTCNSTSITGDATPNTTTPVFVEGTASYQTVVFDTSGYTAARDDSFVRQYYRISSINGVETGNAFTVVVADTFTVAPTSEGTIIVEYAITDGCNWDSSTHTITVTCSLPVPDETLVAVCADDGDCFAGTSINLFVDTADENIASYSWGIQSHPDVYGDGGVFAFTGSSTTENTTTDTDASFGAGNWVFEVNITDICGQVSTETVTQSLTCEHAATDASAEDTTVEFDGQVFPRVDLHADVTFARSETDKDDFMYEWVILDAPDGSVYDRWYNTSVTMSVPNVDSEEVVLSENTTVVTVTNYTVSTTTAEYFAKLDNSDDNDIDTFPACFFPDVAGEYRVQLRFWSGDACFRDESVEVTVTAGCGVAPDAVINVDAQYELTSEFATPIILDGSASTKDADADLSYSWGLISVPDVNVSQAEITNENSPVAGIVADLPGFYTVELNVTDGCQMDTATATFELVYECTAPPNYTDPESAYAFDYIARVTTGITLNGDEGDANSAIVYTGDLSAGDSASYPQNTEYSDAYTKFTQIQCDTVYKWQLVDFSYDSAYTAADPCSGNSRLLVCGGEGASIPKAKEA